jgi:hypothetical protein
MEDLVNEPINCENMGHTHFGWCYFCTRYFPQYTSFSPSGIRQLQYLSGLRWTSNWHLETNEISSDTIMRRAVYLPKESCITAFSPLVRAHAGSPFSSGQSRRRPSAGMPGVRHALVSYGLTRNLWI